MSFGGTQMHARSTRGMIHLRGMTATASTSTPRPGRAPVRARSLAEWLHSIGDVPPHRVLLDPPPGTVTLEQYIRLDGRVNDRLVELVDNTLVEKPMGMLEGAIAALVIQILGNHVRPHGLGIVLDSQGMIRMFGGNIRMPDVSFIANADLDREKLHTQAAPQFAPTLAVEIISPSNTPAEMDTKLREYFQSGCKMAWLLYPETRTLRAYRSPEQFVQLAPDDVLDGGTVLPGFSTKVADFFAI